MLKILNYDGFVGRDIYPYVISDVKEYTNHYAFQLDPLALDVTEYVRISIHRALQSAKDGSKYYDVSVDGVPISLVITNNDLKSRDEMKKTIVSILQFINKIK